MSFAAMLYFKKRSERLESLALAEALGRSHGVIEFAPDGTILAANRRFLDAIGYSLSEIKGRSHGMLLDSSEAGSQAYREFWDSLNRGASHSGEFRHVRKDGQDIWLEASYNPLIGRSGKIERVVKFATDVTTKKLERLEAAGMIGAILRSQATIEFKLDGTIIRANQNFLTTMGYSLSEIQGRHHSMFVQPSERESESYRAFWTSLRRGEYQAAEFKRLAKDGREVWILATYNPILDRKGKPLKVVKFATDVTAQKIQTANYVGQIEAIRKSGAVIEFDMDGTIQDANEKFLNAVGYSLAEIKGQHHSMFLEQSERNSSTYHEFWATLNRGQYQAAEYKRIGKDGREVWIQASYNPILDLNGKPFKVVKIAADTTEQVLARKRSEYVRSTMETVAAGAEELSTSVREISGAMIKSKNMTATAVGEVDAADRQEQRLTAAAKSMGGIIQMIGSITGQINLLALNATIESARAGEAGRGFAVVASEVKSLASQAREAADKIAGEIESLNEISSDVTAALNRIKTAIQAVSQYVTSTTAAVEQQAIVTSEMTTSMQRAAAEAASIG